MLGSGVIHLRRSVTAVLRGATVLLATFWLAFWLAAATGGAWGIARLRLEAMITIVFQHWFLHQSALVA